MLPKYHILDDSLEEMITVGRDTLINREHMRKASCSQKLNFLLKRSCLLKLPCCFGFDSCWYRCLGKKSCSNEALPREAFLK